MPFYILANGIDVAYFDDPAAAPKDATETDEATFVEKATAVHTTPDQQATNLRADRDAAISATDWLVTRQRDETDAGSTPTLTADQYKDLLSYRQALRDLPNVDGFPNVALPAVPSFMTVDSGSSTA